jgi:hypothetical protein
MPPVDFYAGAIATVVVILFAKFDTHRRHNECWKMAHIACAITAWLGLVLPLLVLGWMDNCRISKRACVTPSPSW